MQIKEIALLADKEKIATEVLHDLHDWFGIPESTAEYIDKSRHMPFFAAYDCDKPVGFLAIKKNNASTAEIYVMGILQAYHRQGIGRSLFNACLSWCRKHNLDFLQVKTVDASYPDEAYAKTREYYKAMGFKPLECIPEIWGKDCPCLILVMSVKQRYK